jgi:hypothetical protein
MGSRLIVSNPSGHYKRVYCHKKREQSKRRTGLFERTCGCCESYFEDSASFFWIRSTIADFLSFGASA